MLNAQRIHDFEQHVPKNFRYSEPVNLKLFRRPSFLNRQTDSVDSESFVADFETIHARPLGATRSASEGVGSYGLFERTRTCMAPLSLVGTNRLPVLASKPMVLAPVLVMIS
jgi:hypothetical protein